MKKLFILPLFAALLLLGACESEAPMTAPENVLEPVAASVDAQALPFAIELGDFTSLHADVRHLVGEYQTEWRLIETDEFVGWGDDVVYKPTQLGQHWLACRIWQEEVVVLSDSTRLTVTPPDDVSPISVNAWAATPSALIGTTTLVSVDVEGGEGRLDYLWRKNDGTIVGNTQSIYYDFQSVDPDTLIIFVTDEIGQWDNDSVVLIGQADDDDPEDPEAIDWSVCTNLVTRVNDRQDTEMVEIGYSGEFHLWAKLRFDISPRKDVRIWFTYSDGSVRYFPVIPDVMEQRPAVVMVDLGHALVEEVQSVTLYLTTNPSKAAAGGGDDLKCDGTVKLLELKGSNEVPQGSYDQLIVLRQGGLEPILVSR